MKKNINVLNNFIKDCAYLQIWTKVYHKGNIISIIYRRLNVHKYQNTTCSNCALKVRVGRSVHISMMNRSPAPRPHRVCYENSRQFTYRYNPDTHSTIDIPALFCCENYLLPCEQIVLYSKTFAHKIWREKQAVRENYYYQH